MFEIRQQYSKYFKTNFILDRSFSLDAEAPPDPSIIKGKCYFRRQQMVDNEILSHRSADDVNVIEKHIRKRPRAYSGYTSSG